MATCPKCGDPGAPTRGWCLVCGERVDAPSGRAGASAAPPPPREPLTDTLSFEDLEQPTGYAARVVPPVVQPVVQPGPAPVVRPVSAPPRIQPLDEPATRFVHTPAAAPVVRPSAPRVEPVDPAPLVEPIVPEARPEAVPDATRPHATIALRARFEHSSLPGDDPPLIGVLVEMTASGMPLREGVAGPVAHVVLALDVSASMNVPDKYPVLKDAIAQMLADLRAPGAAPVLVSVVIFGKGADVVLRDAVAAKVRPEGLFEAIENHPLCFTRYTDVAGALERAGRIAFDQTRRSPTMPVRIYLLTDGRPQDQALARDVAGRCAKVACDLHALAFGRDADVRTLQDLFAGRRGGTVKSVRRETLGDAFERIAEVAQQVVATRCLVSIDLAPGVVGGAAFRYRPARVRFPDPAFEGGKRFAADLGTIETERTYSLLFEVRPPETEDPISDLGTVTMRIPSFGGPVVSTLRMVVPRTAPGTARGVEDRDVRAARDILDALDDADPQAALRALRLRRQLYEAERRDPGLLSILDRAIDMLAKTGSLAGLSPGEHATLLAHTCTSGADGGRSGAAPRGAAPARGRLPRR